MKKGREGVTGGMKESLNGVRWMQEKEPGEGGAGAVSWLGMITGDGAGDDRGSEHQQEPLGAGGCDGGVTREVETHSIP